MFPNVATDVLFIARWQYMCELQRVLKQELPPCVRKGMILRFYQQTDPVDIELEHRWLRQAPPVRIGNTGELVNTDPDAFARFVSP